MNIRHQCIAVLFSLVSFSWLAKSTVACVDPLNQRSIFVERLPKKDYGATFIGRIKITEVIEQEDLQIATATILQSKTHSDRLNEKLILLYPFPTSCGPYINIGDRGLVMGKIIDGLDKRFTNSTVIVPFESQDYMRGEDFQTLEVGKILHTHEGSFYLEEAESYY